MQDINWRKFGEDDMIENYQNEPVIVQTDNGSGKAIHFSNSSSIDNHGRDNSLNETVLWYAFLNEPK